MGNNQINPKQAFGRKKVPMSCLPLPVMMETGLAMMEGAIKYGRHNYRDSNIVASDYYDAVMRHLGAWWEGEDIDPLSGLPHIVKAMACLVVLRDSQMQGTCVDNRPKPSPAGWMDALNKQLVELQDRMGIDGSTTLFQHAGIEKVEE